MGMFFNPKNGRTQSWSFGGGTQSTAIACLIIQGRLPKPDLAVFVDTGREKQATLAYLHRFTLSALREAGVNLEIIRTCDWQDASVWGGKDSKVILLPGFTTQTGATGKLSNFCSGTWKRDVISRWLRSLAVKQCDQWIGISLDEMRRVSLSRCQWSKNVYPLLELRINRMSCIRIVLDMGWPRPPRSSCWMCPNQSNSEWREMDPDDFALAVAMEREIRETDAHFWLHESCVPLDQVDFTEKPSLFDDRGCNSGHCFV